MRVIAGLCKGRSLLAPPGREVRPTSDRVRTVLFDLLGEAVVNARVLDLFAGAGTLGIEALSRGAQSADFVESQARHAQVIQENLRRTHLEHHGRVILEDAFAFLTHPQRREASYQLILADPPYQFDQVSKLFALMADPKVLGENGLLVWETSIRRDPSHRKDALKLVKERNLGETALRIYQRNT